MNDYFKKQANKCIHTLEIFASLLNSGKGWCAQLGLKKDNYSEAV